MGLSSPTQTDNRAITPGPPEPGLRFGSRLFLSPGCTTAQAGLLGAFLAYLPGAAIVEACTGRAIGGTGNLNRIALTPLGGVA